MENTKLSGFDNEDICDILMQIEASFKIRFYENEFAQVTTFGELCEAITTKIALENFSDCTSQQAFYKLRAAIVALTQIDKQEITTKTNLSKLFPRRNRRKLILKLENKLGFKLNLLSPPAWLNLTLSILLLTSIITAFFNWKIGIFGIILFAGSITIANDFGKEFKARTIGELALKITRESYSNSRRNENSYNKTEVNKLLLIWFKDQLVIEPRSQS